MPRKPPRKLHLASLNALYALYLFDSASGDSADRTGLDALSEVWRRVHSREQRNWAQLGPASEQADHIGVLTYCFGAFAGKADVTIWPHKVDL